MPHLYSPGASLKDDYTSICDMCEKNDGRPTLVWKLQHGRYFILCLGCLAKLASKYLVSIGKISIRRQTISEELRNQIFERDNYRCVKCGKTANLTVDHIIPFSAGGKTEETNLQTLCRSCNSKKGQGERRSGSEEMD